MNTQMHTNPAASTILKRAVNCTFEYDRIKKNYKGI